MARNMAVLFLAVAMLAAFTGNAAAIIGKGGLDMGKGMGKPLSFSVPTLSFETSCRDVCGDKCSLTPKKTCTDVAVPYKECKSVPETTTRKSCKKVCTTVTETTVSSGSSEGKGMGSLFGKGRHLQSKGLPIINLGKFGKGSSNVSCKDECADVPVTISTIKCEDKTKTVSRCSTSFEKSCEKVCRQKCMKVPTLSTKEVQLSGKGKGH